MLMSSFLALVVFVSMFGGAAPGMTLRQRLPDHAVKIGLG